MKNKEKTIYRAYNSYLNLSKDKKNLLDFLCSTSKSIYNTTIYYTNLYKKYKYEIFNEVNKILIDEKIDFGHLDASKIINKKKRELAIKNANKLKTKYVTDKISIIFDKYINFENVVSNQRKNNYPIIKNYILSYLNENKIYLQNNNLNNTINYFQSTIFIYYLKNLQFYTSTINKVVTRIIYEICYNIYTKNYYFIKNKLKNNKDKEFLTKNDKINFKDLIDEFNKNGLKDENNKIPFVYDWSEKEIIVFTDCKIKDEFVIQTKIYNTCNICKVLSSDLTIQIIGKAFDAYKSYLEKRKTNLYKCNKPQFKKSDGKYGLYFLSQFMYLEEINNKYYLRL